MQWPCEFNKRASATCHPGQSRRDPPCAILKLSRRDPSIALGLTSECGVLKFVGQAFSLADLEDGGQEWPPYKSRLSPQLQTQAPWNQNAIKQIEKELHQQRQQRRWNRAFQNRDMIVQIQSADNRFT